MPNSTVPEPILKALRASGQPAVLLEEAAWLVWPKERRSGFITQAIRAGKPERRVKEHSGHASWETFNQYVEEAGTFQDNPAEGIGL